MKFNREENSCVGRTEVQQRGKLPMLDLNMGKVPVRLLAVDIDGTLLNSSFKIATEDMDALHRARAAGVEIIIATGRRHLFAHSVSQQLGFPHWIVSSNGAVTRSSAGETFHRDFLPATVCRELCLGMKDFRGRTVITFDREGKGSLVLEHMADLEASIQRWLEKNLQYIEFVVPIEDCLTEEPLQAMFCGPIAEMQRALDQLDKLGLMSQTTILRTEYPARDLSMVDVLNGGCSKGHALERWARHRGYSRHEVMAIGDNYNDVEMLEWAGIPVIMGNADVELRQRGWHVTRSNDEAGIAAAIDEIVFCKMAATPEVVEATI